jgi:hypothetical protein
MIWIYQRNNEVLRLETRFDNATGEYVLIQHRPEGAQDVERFLTEDDFRARLTKLSAALEEAKWNSQGPPLFLNDGWRL